MKICDFVVKNGKISHSETDAGDIVSKVVKSSSRNENWNNKVSVDKKSSLHQLEQELECESTKVLQSVNCVEYDTSS